jgi:hypothetical protein
MIDIRSRLNYYTGNNNKRTPPVNIGTQGYDIPIKLNFEMYRLNYSKIHPNTHYPPDVIRYLSYVKNKDIYMQCGDSSFNGDWPVMVKVRDTHRNSSGVIVNFDSTRHMGGMFDHPDPPWDSKCDDCVWRGADTGWDGDRLRFVKQYGKSHNVGFSQFVQDALESPHLYTHEMKKPKLSIQEMKKYKYLPVIDGNDKSSSLGWVMASNSVPIMPKPRFHTWACEPWMEPDIHYVEVKKDWSNFDEKLEWCRDNDEKCKEIAENGTLYMMQFMNQTQETYIEKQLSRLCATQGE